MSVKDNSAKTTDDALTLVPSLSDLEIWLDRVAQTALGLAPVEEPRPAPVDPAKAVNSLVGYMRRWLLAQSQPHFERKVAFNAHISDFDGAKVAQYVANHAASLNTTSAEEALIKRGCLVEDEAGQLYPTNAGLLLFGRDPQRFFPSAQITAVRYQGGRISDDVIREDIRGSLPDQIRRAEAFVLTHLTRNFRLSNLDWQVSPALPADVVREVIVNAVAHRAYDIDGDSIRLLVFADRLECYSPGRLPGQITLNNLFTERFGRNEALGQILAELGLMTHLGAGFNRICRRLAETGLPTPIIEETDGGVKVTLWASPLAGPTRQLETGNNRRWVAAGLYERQIKAMDFVTTKGRLTLPDYHRLYPEVAVEILQRDLSGLVERDLLLRVGDGGTTYYIVK